MTQDPFVSTDPDVQAKLIAMGAKGASPDSQVQTMAVSKVTPGVMVPGTTVGSTPSGQGIPSVPTVFQAYTASNPTATSSVPSSGTPSSNIDGSSNGTGTTPTATTGTTAGQAYQGLMPSEDPALAAAHASREQMLKDSQNPINEQSIRDATVQKFQNEIDALNQFYVQKKAQALAALRPAAEARLGSNAAIQARRGMLGGDFGAAQTDKVTGYNASIEQAKAEEIDAERNAAVQSLLGKARDQAQAEIDAKLAARKQGAQEYIDFLKGAAERKVQRVTDTVNNILATNITPDDNTYAALAKELGITPEQLKAKYNAMKVTADAEKAKNAPKAMEINPGNTVIDPVTGKVIYQAPAKDNIPASAQEYEYAVKNGYKGSYTDYQNEDANRKARVEKALSGGLDSLTAGRVDRIAGQFDNEPIVKNYNVVLEGKNFVQSIPSDTKNPADQQGLIYAFAKAMDPNSVVREGEYATVQKYAQSWAQSFGFNAERIFSNSPFLSVEAIKNMKDTINKKYSAIQSQYNNLTSEYGRRINRVTGMGDGTDYLSNYANGATTQGSTSNSTSDYSSKIQGAREQGYSSNEIIQYLQGDPALSGKINQALQSGHSADEILQYLQGSAFNQPLSMGEKGLNKLASSLVSQESGGNYSSIGQIPAGLGYTEADRALGKYQIVPKFHFSKIGLANTPTNRKLFLETPALQDQLFEKIIGGLAQQYNNDPAKIAAAYYGGSNGAKVVGTAAGNKPQYAGGKKYPSINEYVNSVLSRLS